MPRNKYLNVKDILPSELIFQIQQYIQAGGYIWIPSRRIETIKRRNHQIYYQRKIKGMTEKATAELYGITTRRIRQIIQQIEIEGPPERILNRIAKAEKEAAEEQEEQKKLEIVKAPRKKYQRKNDGADGVDGHGNDDGDGDDFKFD